FNSPELRRLEELRHVKLSGFLVGTRVTCMMNVYQIIVNVAANRRQGKPGCQKFASSGACRQQTQIFQGTSSRKGVLAHTRVPDSTRPKVRAPRSTPPSHPSKFSCLSRMRVSPSCTLSNAGIHAAP